QTRYSSRESLSDYEAVRSRSARNEFDCALSLLDRSAPFASFSNSDLNDKHRYDIRIFPGLNSLHALTASGPRKLRILMKAWNDSEHWAEYSSFSVGPESDNYRLSVSGFSGSAGIGDCFTSHSGMQFTTKDADHDTRTGNCATDYIGAWWFTNCHCSNLNGEYKNSSEAIGGVYAEGVIWRLPFGNHYSLMEIEMLLLLRERRQLQLLCAPDRDAARGRLFERPMVALLLLLLAAVPRHVTEAASSVQTWHSSRESLSDYEAVRSRSARNGFDSSGDSTVQLAAFNASSSLCALFRCRLGLSHCRKCRNANKGAQRVWTAHSDCWTTVQHRVSGSVDFYRNWTQYQSEFGEGPDGNYWIGLNSLHALTASGPRKLRILMKAWNDSEHWAEYSSFSVGPESDNYRLSVSGFSGSAGIGDCFTSHSGMQFTTKDADHDTRTGNCATDYIGAWWFNNCHCSNLNGEYKNSSEAIGGVYAEGVIWRLPFGNYYSLMEIEMLLL
uniref:Fibrinogen C-terminal domain-containing protein n=1 Tax=Macrostomum lignano TaxID=282301 RepID=A0A1I8IMH1_9PLAT